MNRHDRRGGIAKGRADRISAFRRKAGGAGFNTSLRAVGEHHPRDRAAIANWFMCEPSSHPTCFGCRALFTPTTRRPGGFLCAVSIRVPQAGIAVAGICAECWDSKSPEQIEAAALAVLRRQLGARGFAD
jgi:hypothetical protein